LASASIALGVSACGSKTPEPAKPSAPAPVVAEAPATKTAPAGETPPAVVAAPAVNDPAVVPTVEPPAVVDAPPVAADSGLPGLWAPLFVVGHESTWEVKVHLKTLDIDRDPSEPSVYKEEDKGGDLTCRVASVEQLENKFQKSTVTCEGFDDTGTGDSPAGIWMTDGTRVWIPSEGDLPDQLTLPAEPAPKKWQLGEGEEVEIVYEIKAGEDAGAWCFSAGYQMGDGGVSEVCFSKDKGPYLYKILTGSAVQDITVTMRVK